MLTTDQITALAPDVASFKAGRELAVARKWKMLGSDSEALWGLAVGSGKKPYQTQVALDDLAAKCSCPSRKFPCKHALGLMFLAAGDPAALTETERPAWVEEWLESRRKRAENAAKKKAGAKSATAAAKRREKRLGRIENGIGHLESVLRDLVRNGLGREEVSGEGFWRDLARRMVDAQAPGLAGWVRRLGELPHGGPDWERTLLHELGTLQLLLTTYRRRSELEPDMRAEVEQLVGLTPEKEDILTGQGITDRWFVAARKQSEQDRLVTSATWLYGLGSSRWALVLRFAALPSRPAEPWPLGSVIETKLVYYPGVLPDRVLPRNESAAAQPGQEAPEPEGGFLFLLESYANALAANPWRGRRPFLVAAQPTRHCGQPVLIDREGLALPWLPTGNDEDLLASISAGHPVTLCGEWNGRALSVHSADDAGSWFSLHPPAA